MVVVVAKAVSWVVVAGVVAVGAVVVDVVAVTSSTGVVAVVAEAVSCVVVARVVDADAVSVDVGVVVVGTESVSWLTAAGLDNRSAKFGNRFLNAHTCELTNKEIIRFSNFSSSLEPNVPIDPTATA